ncbi:hypothetical protein OESDEN_10708 [Oesophagostomum dentatum]|uniref:Uncharacterized protein n=1 Tax=Oesophagostomum dentatum TaxID=61180 RepID=A0A0B1SZW5_OESDE|nr:hypothetical protein OESDEN_10708 [Oesophagostomum dentatum]
MTLILIHFANEKAVITKIYADKLVLTVKILLESWNGTIKGALDANKRRYGCNLSTDRLKFACIFMT